jgi:nucleoside-triphosphatase THEP1
MSFLTSNTRSGFRASDLAAVERALLAHPDFDEIQVGGYRVTRRFIEAARDLEESGVAL